MEYVHVKNLEKYHPGYKDRELIWCKTYFTMLNADPDFEMLCEIDKWRLVAFIMLELQVKNPVPLNEDYLKRKGFQPQKRRISSSLQMLQKFISVVTEEGKVCVVDKSREEKKREEKKGFQPPSLSDIQNYIKEKKYQFVNAESFVNFYGSKGWLVGKSPMKDWHQALAGWEAREKAKHPEQQKPTSPPVQQAVCICRKPARTYRQNENRERIDLCGDCDKAARLMGSFVNRPIGFAELERRIEQGKKRLQERSTPKPKDPELAQADKQRVAVRKLVEETAGKLKDVE